MYIYHPERDIWNTHAFLAVKLNSISLDVGYNSVLKVPGAHELKLKVYV